METNNTTPDDLNANPATIHLILQGKCGVGKSLIASWLSEFLIMRGKSVQCIDGDPVNRSLWQYKALRADKLDPVNHDGELKALVSSNVYDTATGRYLLIPQGSRLIGKYDSRISYAQNGVQVAWNRIIFPDASSIDLDGMVGLDSHGNAGLRHKVDHHYKRLIGFSALTSLFNAAFAISQRGNRSVLAYPTPGEAASQAVGQQLSQMGSQMTRRNLDVQPTIKVPAGYKFTVRVNRDIAFDAPYQPMQAETDGPRTPNGNEEENDY